MTTRHRKCGCDCNDQTRWVEDTGILQATFDCGCADSKKPPCVYWANFECAVNYRGDVFPPPEDQVYQYGLPYSRGANYRAEQLRPTCKWGPEGRYVSLRDGVPATTQVLRHAIVDGSCTWDDLLGFGTEVFGAGWNNRSSQSQWQALELRIRWTLQISETSMTLSHYGGAQYALPAGATIDCFGANTLILDMDPKHYPDYSTLPRSVCVTPDVYAVKNPPEFCNQCYAVTIPQISSTNVTIPSQKIRFLRAGIEPIVASQYVGVMQQGSVNSPFVFRATVGNPLAGGRQFAGGREFWELTFLDPVKPGESSRSTMQIPIDLQNFGGQNYGEYYCDQFRCGLENTFTLATASADWPSTLTLAPDDCTRSDQYQWGPCWKSDGPVSWEAGYPSGETEESRKNCCDPWCSCAPGWLKVFNPTGSHLYQSFGGITTNPTTSTAFCAGGRYGMNSPSNISREWCLPTVYAADGTAHEVCMVLYCGSGGGGIERGGGVTWLIDWYCDGTFVATRNMNQVLTCCPNQMAQLGPEMPCLPGAVLCVGINIEPACEPPPPPCCNLSDYQSTLTLTMYTTGCSGWPATVTLTKSGSVFSGSFSVGSDAVLVTFDCVNPVNGVSCGIKFVCSSTGTNRVGQMESTTCSPPTLTGSVGLGLTFFCGCGAISSVACVLNTP